MNFFLPLQRIRHARGFGIHSPAAFKFVTEILRTPYSYYAYEEIDDSLPESADGLHRLRHDARLLHRIAARHRFNLCIIAAQNRGILENAVKLADPKLTITDSIPSEIPAESLIFLQKGPLTPDAAAAAVKQAKESIVMLRGFPPDEIESMIAEADTGFNLVDRRLAILCRTNRMKFVSYETRL